MCEISQSRVTPFQTQKGEQKNVIIRLSISPTVSSPDHRRTPDPINNHNIIIKSWSQFSDSKTPMLLAMMAFPLFKAGGRTNASAYLHTKNRERCAYCLKPQCPLSCPGRPQICVNYRFKSRLNIAYNVYMSVLCERQKQ